MLLYFFSFYLPASNLDRDILTQKWLVFIARFVVMFFLTGSVKIGGILFNNIASGDMSGALTGFMLILPYAIGRLCGKYNIIYIRYTIFRLISGAESNPRFIFSNSCWFGMII